MKQQLHQNHKQKPSRLWQSFSFMGIAVGILILLACLWGNLAFGAANIPLEEVYRAFTAYDGSTEHLIIRTVRLPRSLIATFVGAALAVAGAIMQVPCW